ncbi:MAG: 30S ribosomal protein S7 [Rickettsiales bacterium]|nr:30S ribosomal protein S7 [Rickettsiales bacterium]
MSRRHRAVKREVLPDAKYGDLVLTKFMNGIMLAGKKSTAERIVYGAFELIEAANEDPIKTFHDAIENVKPTVEVRSRRVGGATYQVPQEVREDRRVALAIRWLVADMRSRRDKEAIKKLQMALLDAANNRGGAIKKREDTHKMAEANRAFAHFRW